MDIHGTCSDQFEPVRRAFAENFEEGLEVGAATAVTVDGEFVVDLWAGDADPAGTPWGEDTIVNVYSTTKTMAATVMLALADRGELDFDAPVARYWPEFARNGKEGVLVRHVMSHTAGLPGLDGPPAVAADLYDHDALAARLAGQTCWWEPGTKSGYHAVTQGTLEAEIVRRITGRTLGTWFREEIAEPLGADFHIGLPASEDGRVAELIPPDVVPDPTDLEVHGVKIEPDSIAARTLTSFLLDATEPRTREWRAAEIPAAGGIGNARSIARIHSMLANDGEVDGIRIMSEAAARKALEVQIDNVDEVLLLWLRHGIGFARVVEGWETSPNENHMFWGGWGGSLAIVDFDARMSIAYVMNRMDADLTADRRGARITEAAYASL